MPFIMQYIIVLVINPAETMYRLVHQLFKYTWKTAYDKTICSNWTIKRMENTLSLNFMGCNLHYTKTLSQNENCGKYFVVTYLKKILSNSTVKMISASI